MEQKPYAQKQYKNLICILETNHGAKPKIQLLQKSKIRMVKTKNENLNFTHALHFHSKWIQLYRIYIKFRFFTDVIFPQK